MNISARRIATEGRFLLCFGAACALLLSIGHADTTLFDYTMSDGAVPSAAISSAAGGAPTVVSNATLDPSGTGNSVLQLNSAGVTAFNLGSTYDPATSGALTVSLNFSFASASTANTINLGLLNNNGTAVTGSTGFNTSDDSGVWQTVSYSSSKLTLQAVSETGTNSGLFGGTDRTYGTASSSSTVTSGGDTNAHTLSLAYSWNGSAYVLTSTLDGTLVTSYTSPIALSLNELVVYAKSGALQIDDVTLTLAAVPEPRVNALLMLGGMVVALGCGLRSRLV